MVLLQGRGRGAGPSQVDAEPLQADELSGDRPGRRVRNGGGDAMKVTILVPYNDGLVRVEELVKAAQCGTEK